MILAAIKNIIHPEKRNAVNTPAVPSLPNNPSVPPSSSSSTSSDGNSNLHEIRFYSSSISITEEERAGKKKPVISGYAAVFNSRSQFMGFYETIAPGAFAKSLRSGPDTVAVIEHGGGLETLGRKSAGTLRMQEDQRGLKVEIDPPDTSAGRDVIELLRRGDLHQMSFGFRTISDSWHYEDGEDIRTLIEVELFDVSIVSSPAYLSTSVGIRSLADVHSEGKARMQQIPNINNNNGDEKAEQRRLELELDMLELS